MVVINGTQALSLLWYGVPAPTSRLGSGSSSGSRVFSIVQGGSVTAVDLEALGRTDGSVSTLQG